MEANLRKILTELIDRYPKLITEQNNIEAGYRLLFDCYQNNAKVLTCGNGGSAADAGHITAELMKGFLCKRSLNKTDKMLFEGEEQLADKLQYGLPAIALSAQSELITAIANDNGAEMVFAQQVFAYGRKNDILIAISTSGNSLNVVNAVKVAKKIDMKVLALTGAELGIVGRLADVVISAPEYKTFKIQEYHLPLYHALCAMLEAKFFDSNEGE